MIEMRWIIEHSGEEGGAGCSWVRGEHSGLFCKLQYRYWRLDPSVSPNSSWSEWKNVAPPTVAITEGV